MKLLPIVLSGIAAWLLASPQPQQHSSVAGKRCCARAAMTQVASRDCGWCPAAKAATVASKSQCRKAAAGCSKAARAAAGRCGACPKAAAVKLAKDGKADCARCPFAGKDCAGKPCPKAAKGGCPHGAKQRSNPQCSKAAAADKARCTKAVRSEDKCGACPKAAAVKLAKDGKADCARCPFAGKDCAGKPCPKAAKGGCPHAAACGKTKAADADEADKVEGDEVSKARGGAAGRPAAAAPVGFFE